jgi:general secretion pathway protein G
MRPHRDNESGFTLIELMVVVTIIGILAATAMVAVKYYQRKAQETALRDDLTQMRKALDNFYADKQHYPADLNELVPNYLRKVPVDPITKQVDWEGVVDQPNPDEPADTNPDAAQQAPGIVDVKCKAPGKTMDNVAYSDL